jgi:predicted DNA binding CopG/RHH family protein
MKPKRGLKPLPRHRSDAAAARFVESADLANYDLSRMKPMRFELMPKEATVSMRMPQGLLDAIKTRAARDGVPYQRLIRSILDSALSSKPL